MLKNKKRNFLIFNILGLQFTWAACAYGATHEMPMLGLYTGMIYIFLHFLIVEERIRDIKVMLLIAGLGLLMDTINAAIGVVAFPLHSESHYILPYWLIALWLVFALMIPYSLYWFHKRLFIASIAGALGGAFSYWMGDKLGALSLPLQNHTSLITYAVEWGILFPLALLFVVMLDRETVSLDKQTQNNANSL